MGLLGDIGGVVGGFLDRHNANKMAEADRAWQKEVMQNQLQWKAADARKAGLHPLAAIGGGAYSGSPSSVPSSSFAQSLGKLGDSIGDAFIGHMNKKQIAEEVARSKKMEDENHEASLRTQEAQTQYYSAMAMEAARRSLSYTKPRATGREPVPGQTDARDTSISSGSSGSTYSVRNLGRGFWDINFNSDYQQELGDEFGQVFNLVDRGRRSLSSSDVWVNPDTGIGYRYDRREGKWYIAPRYSKNKREAFGKIYR